MLRRWRTSRGFGVHSPLAFELITQVLCDDTAVYYSTAELPSRRSRRWLRLFARLNPQSVVRLGAPLPEVDAALAAACPHARVSDASYADATLAIAVSPSQADLAAIAALPSPRLAVLLVDSPPDHILLLSSPCGMLSFSDGREHLAVRLTTPVTQHFDITMR